MKKLVVSLVVVLAASLATLYRTRQEVQRTWSYGVDWSEASSPTLCRPRHDQSICQRLLGDDPDILSASLLWRRYRDRIFQASLHPRDSTHQHDAWTRALLEFLSPTLLRAGLKETPSAVDVQNVARLIEARLANPSTARSLQVAVLGGSVTEGRGCETVFTSSSQPNQNKIQGRSCAWPFRLQLMADAILGQGVVEVHNLATGGTNSLQSLPVLQYWLFPNKSSTLYQHGPDVVINAYSTNDNHYSWREDANATQDFEHFDTSFASAHRFVEAARSSRNGTCQPPPLVLFVDEYLGNNHGLILGEDLRHEAVGMLAQSTRTAYISSALAVRPLVYANSNETLFSAPWYAKDGRGRPTKWYENVHFGMPGHVFVSWVVAYGVLESVVQYCQDEVEGDDSWWLDDPNRTLTSQQNHAPLPNGKSDVCLTNGNTPQQQSPCPFAFLATPVGTTRNAGRLKQYLAPYITSDNGGWKAENDIRNGWQNKLGLVAHEFAASMTLTLSNLTQPVQKLHIHYLRSYGPEWEGSRTEFQLAVRSDKAMDGGSSYQTSFVLEGFHNDSTSLAYPHLVDLGSKRARVGQSVDLTFKLLSGSNFKIIALMLCSR